MNEELINEIVRRILAAPSLQGLLQADNEETTAVKPKGLVLLNFVSDFERVLTTVKKRWGVEYTLDILSSESVLKAKPELPEGMNWITPQDALSTDWQKIMIPACSPNTLAKAALGLRDNPLSEMIGRGISRGKPIELVTEYLGLTAQTPPAYRDLYDGYLRTIQSYGVQVFVTLGDKCPLVKNVKNEETEAEVQAQAQAQATGAIPTVTKPGQPKESELQKLKEIQKLSSTSCETIAVTPEVIRYEKKFLADKDAYGFPEESVVMVKRLTVVSPLARDTLKLRRIELRQEMEDGRL